MKERPILFSAPMVRAILDGRKTQTRRVVKNVPDPDWEPSVIDDLHGYDSGGALNPDKIVGYGACDSTGEWGVICPYGRPGDRLWVRENWGAADLCMEDCETDPPRMIAYRSDGAVRSFDPPHDYKPGYFGLEDVKWRPSIHMPRWASRITLEVTSIRCERLTVISELDAQAEGVTHEEAGDYYCDQDEGVFGHRCCYRRGFERLFDSINGAGSWDKNPWVWVVEFKRVED